LRIFYLHDLLLGWISTSLLILIDTQFVLVPWRRLRLAIYALWELGVVVMLAALLGFGLTGLIPIPGAYCAPHRRMGQRSGCACCPPIDVQRTGSTNRAPKNKASSCDIILIAAVLLARVLYNGSGLLQSCGFSRLMTS
jgi:hypothetical protein